MMIVVVVVAAAAAVVVVALNNFLFVCSSLFLFIHSFTFLVFFFT
jgi:hypothetical protein